MPTNNRGPCIFGILFFVLLLMTIQGLDCYTPENNSIEVEEEPAGDCPIAFHKIGDKCYFYGYFKLNWFRAMEFCHSFGESVSLACIESHQENNHLKDWLIANGDHTTGVWVGGSDNGHVGRWAWFPTGQLIRNFNWGPSQPSGGDQHCMYIVGGYLGYQWADFHCGFEMTFLCEYQVNDIEAWRRRRQMIPDHHQSMMTQHYPAKNSSHQQGYFQNQTTDLYEKIVPKVIRSGVTSNPSRNSVVISTTTSRNSIHDVESNQTKSTSKDDWTIYNFLKSIVKLG